MSLINSVLGSFSPPPKFRRSFEDPHARDHELPLYNSPPSQRIPPPITSSVIWSTPDGGISPVPRVPDDVLTLQRRARHLEQQLQKLLDAQADGLLSGLDNNDDTPDDLLSNGSTTPTVSSARSEDKSTQDGTNEHKPTKGRLDLSTTRRGIFRRIQQLASVKAEELDMLDEGLRDLQINVEKTEAWTQKRARLETKIQAIEGEDAGAKTQALQTEASKLEQEIRQKEEELWTLKRRQRRVMDELADTENSQEAKLSSYKTSVSLLDKEVSSFLARPPNANHVPLSTSPFPTLPPKRRTIEMAHEYWQDEYTRLAEKCEEVDVERAALEEGAILWNDTVKKVAEYEASLQRYMYRVGKSGPADPTRLLSQMDATITFLDDKLEYATSRSWNLLMCAIGAELEAFQQGRDLLHDALGVKRKGKEKATSSLVELQDFGPPQEEMAGSAIRIGRSPPKPAPTKPSLFETDDDSNDDPDPELMISHQDTDTD
jgi:signal recognition particle subunit SEC65